MGTRFCYSHLDQLAKENKVRIIHPDRPGIGGSDPVKLEERISVWLEMVPLLLKHLNIKHVSLASHSGGLVYALNTLLTHPHLLHPTHPYVAFFAPWVHHSHSGVSTMLATSFLPTPLIGKFASLARFVNNNVSPLVGLSGNLIDTLTPTSNPATPPLPAPVQIPALAPLPQDQASFSACIRPLIMQYLFAEAIDGISADAQLFLKKGSGAAWSPPPPLFTDLDSFVPLLAARRAASPFISLLHIDAFHGEKDDMVGAKGARWFDQCWEQMPASGKVEYRSQTMQGTEHNYLLDARFGVSELWLGRVRGAFGV